MATTFNLVIERSVIKTSKVNGGEVCLRIEIAFSCMIINTFCDEKVLSENYFLDFVVVKVYHVIIGIKFVWSWFAEFQELSDFLRFQCLPFWDIGSWLVINDFVYLGPSLWVIAVWNPEMYYIYRGDWQTPTWLAQA